MTMASEAHPCPTPQATKKNRHALWICDCGQAWIAHYWSNYAGEGFEWQTWPKVRL